MIESVESHTETRIITTREGQLDALGSPFLKRVAILDDDTLLATFIKKEIDLDRPVAIGVTILERSKALMYSFLYEGKLIFWDWSLSLYFSSPVIYPYFKGPKACQPMYMDTWVSFFLPSLNHNQHHHQINVFWCIFPGTVSSCGYTPRIWIRIYTIYNRS